MSTNPTNTGSAFGAGSIFGQPSTTGTSPGLFGNASSAGATTTTPAFGSTPAGSNAAGGTTNIFGGGLNFGANTGTSSFGNPTTSAAPATGTTPASSAGSIFGNPGGAFGSTATGSTSGLGGGIFGNTGNNAATGASPFGNAGASNPASGGGLFGFGSNASSNNNGAASTNPPATQSAFTGFGQPKPTESAATTSATTPAAPAPASAPSLFSGFGAPKPADTSAAKPTTSSFFSQPPASVPGSTAAVPAGTATAAAGGLFGGFGKKPDAPASSSTTATTAPPTLPPFSLGLNKDTPSTNTTTAPAAGTSAPTGFFNLGGNKDANKEGEKKDTPAAFSLFGTKDASTEKKDTPATTAAPTSFGLFGAKKDGASSTPAATTLPTFSLGGASTTPKDADKQTAPVAGSSLGATTTSTAISVPPPSMLRGKTIEEIVNKWSTDLDVHVKEFNQFASEVAAWDRTLIENTRYLSTIYGFILEAEREQNEIDQTLDHIEQQQRDLSITLDVYEKKTDQYFEQGGKFRALDTGPADTERDKNYQLATELHGHLDDLSLSLVQMIEAVNTISGPETPDKGAGEDPMAQISQILSSHLESLQWIDGAVKDVETKVGDVEKQVRGITTDNSNGSGAGPKSRGYGLGR